jgi:hypothetical protein
VASYIFPAGGQRGRTVKVRVGGLYLYSSCGFELLGTGVRTGGRLRRTRTVWFEGPRLPLVESQQPEDYPQDMAGEVRIAAGAAPGVRLGRLWTAEGAASGLAFVVGNLPEVVEEEVDGDPVPVAVNVPVTINGRIFPRGDIDLWSFHARKGQVVTAEVCAAQIGSPLDSLLDVLDEKGRVLAENDDASSRDSRLHFVAPEDGTYTVRIRDAAGRGGQAFVYRLTLRTSSCIDSVFPLGGRRGTTVALQLSGLGVPRGPVAITIPADAPPVFAHHLGAGTQATTPILLDTDDLPEVVQVETNAAATQAQVVTPPVVSNGRIDRPGDVDQWAFRARKGQALLLELRARQLGSRLSGVLAVSDAAGKELARAEPPAAGGDPALSFTAPADSIYRASVRDRFRTRGGPTFAYRLRIAPPPAPDFRLRLASPVLTVPRGGQARLAVSLERIGGFAGAVALAVQGLPGGIKAASTTIPAGQVAADIVFTADAAAPVASAVVQVRGTATVRAKHLTRTASARPLASGPEIDSVRLVVALPVPFKVVGDYDLRLVPRGTVHRRRYKVVRNGYQGPLEVHLADHQMRHLQGVTGPVLTVPAGANEFEYPITLPPWMETGRTSRSCVMAIGVINDGGTAHEVGYSSEAQNDQIIAVVEAGPLGLQAGRSSVLAQPGGSVTVPVSVHRGEGLAGPVKVEPVLPGHIRGMRAEALVIPALRSDGLLTLHFGAEPGPFNMPLVLRATLTSPAGPVIAETQIEVVAQR